MLFVLRLLPPYKKAQQRIIYVELFVNFAITLIATLTFGIACTPFKALYTYVPGAECFSKEKLVAVTRVNARRNLPNQWFGMIEETFGTGFACAPAIRQLYGYYRRTGTILPGKDRQSPNEDFLKMRRKVNIRDIFWYRQAILKDGRIRDAYPIFQRKTGSDIERLAVPERLPSDAPPVTEKSVLDWWEGGIKKVFCGSSASRSSNECTARHKGSGLSRRLFKSQGLPNPETDVADSGQDPSKPWNKDLSLSPQEADCLSAKYKNWGLPLNRKQEDPQNSLRGPFKSGFSAEDDSALGTHSVTEPLPGSLASSTAPESSESEILDHFYTDATARRA
ncbi:MAG: hypothetical protein Q9165_003458 [Trypethelium subeluteriae]